MELMGQRSNRVPSRLPRGIRSGEFVQVEGSTHPKVARSRVGARLDAGQPLDRLMLVLKSSAEQQEALEQLLAEQHDPSSPRFNQWLTPEQFGERFGPSADDVATITNWLQSQGLRVDQVAPGRRSIEFSGTVGQVEAAFHTQMNRVEVDGESHIANTLPLEIPADLAPVVEGTLSLHDFHSKAMSHGVSEAQYTAGSSHYLSPNDYATIYNVRPLWTAGTDGTGQSIAVISRTNVVGTDFTTFRSNMGLPANPLQIVLNGADPGIVSGDDVEADLDMEWAGALAKNAAVKLIVSKSTTTSDGIDLSAQYAVNNNSAPIITISYGACEAAMGSAGTTFYSNLWQQAAAQGQSVFISTGDSGAAGCDSGTSATHGFGINGLGSSAYNVAVGGTQFLDTASPTTYWSASNSAGNSSALSYIPETVWNESGAVTGGSGLWAGSGGYSLYIARPSWQASIPTPAGATASVRLVPDVSLSGAGHDGYLVYHNGGLIAVGGTSASTPAFASLMALIDQRNGRVGNPNVKLYALAASNQASSIFHDVTTGSNSVPCTANSPNCVNGRLTGFNATVGYDLASGWGSVDATALVNAWSNAPVPLSLTSLSPNPISGSTAAQTLTINGTGFVSGMTVKLGNSAPVAATLVSSTQIRASVVTGAGPATLAVTVTSGTTTSNSLNLTVLGPPPAITTISPTSMVGSTSPQTLTINGSGFVSPMTVRVGSLSPITVTTLTATQLSVPVTVGTTATTLNVIVTNPSGQSSNAAPLTITAPPVAALTLSTVTPGSVFVSSTARSCTLTGTGFTNGMTVKIGTGITLTNVNPTSSTSLTVQATLTTAGTYPVTVSRTTPTAATSVAVNLIVTAQGATPTITKVTPNPFTGSNTGQLLTITGTNFRNGLRLSIGTASAVLNPTNATTIQVFLTTGTTARTLPVQVTNSDGTFATASLTVTAPAR